MRKLILTEKPSVARDYANFLCVKGNRDGYIENNEYIITWCIGHLIRLKYPNEYSKEYEKWNIEALPFLPVNYEYTVIEDVKKQFDIVKKLIETSDIDTIYYAGDSGREGQGIAELVRRNVFIRNNIEELRVWIDSFTKESILNGIKNAKPMSYYDNIGTASIMRGIEDYAMGINFTRALSVKFAHLVIEKEYKPITVGRVMTCILGMVARRELEIENFKEDVYYTVTADVGFDAAWKVTSDSKWHNSLALYNDVGFKNKSDAEMVVPKTAKFYVKNKIIKNEKKNPPVLFNLAELQSKCSTLFHISPDETLNIAQKLYESGYITYPRTDARVLSSAMNKEVYKILNNLGTAYTYVSNITKTSVNKPYVDDSKITDHFAIIPTGKIPSGLTGLDEAVFDLICRRFVSIFCDPAEYSAVKIEVRAENESFFASEKINTKKGYMALYPDAKEDIAKYKFLDSLNENDELNLNELIIKTAKTSPPKRYTTGSMILAMENAGKLIEDEDLRSQIISCGIGTSATRAGIIKKLIDNKQLSVVKKTQTLSPTNFGMNIFKIVSVTIPGLLIPEMTASWEKGLKGIEEGTVSFDFYNTTLNEYVNKEIIRIKQMSDSALGVIPNKSSFSFTETKCRCPLCGSIITHNYYDDKEWYSCSDYKKCKFSVNSINETLLSEEDLAVLITGAPTRYLTFTTKTGKEYNARLIMYNTENGPQISFYNEGTDSSLNCPKCYFEGRTTLLKENEERYFCSCGFSILKTWGNLKITEDDFRELFGKKKTRVIDGFYSTKKNKYYSASIKMDKNFKASFEFPKKSNKK